MRYASSDSCGHYEMYGEYSVITGNRTRPEERTEVLAPARFNHVSASRTYLRRGRRCSSSVRIGTGCSGGSIKPSATPRSWSQF